MNIIRGAGGGGGKGGGRHTPTESDDSLHSIQYAKVLDLLCEGPIQGLDNSSHPENSIYLDGTPIKDSSGTPRFPEDKYSTITDRLGTVDQGYISDLGGFSSPESVNQDIHAGWDEGTDSGTSNGKTPHPGLQIGTSDNAANTDRVKVTIRLNALQVLTDKGDIVPNEVELAIQLKYANDADYYTIKTDKITGKSSASYKREYTIIVDGDDTNKWPINVKVKRITGDPSSQKRQSTIVWETYQAISDEKLRYPYSALMYLRFDSSQFNRIPTRKYKIRGLKVKIPNTATVDTTTYIGRITYSDDIFTGTLGAAQWTNDPAWCLWDLLTNSRYGVGIPESSLDVFDFYAISQYCNELVATGRSDNSQEPRFSCNLIINSRAEVYNVINSMTSIFRGMAYYGAGALVTLQDKPQAAQYLLGISNVVEGRFEYSGTSQKARHTVVTVKYQTYDSLGDVRTEYVEDSDAVAKYGIIQKDIQALGCYSQGQARRLGKWTLLSEQNLTQTVTFSVDISSGIILRPGMVIDIADEVKAGLRRSGRITSATTQTVTIDSNSTITDTGTILTKSPTLSVLLPTGLVETRPIDSFNEKVITIDTSTSDGAFSEAPNPESVWLIQTNDVLSQQYRVVAVSEEQTGIHTIVALEYNSTIYDAVEADAKVEQRDISNLTEEPGLPILSPNNDEYLYQRGQNVLVGFSLSWTTPTDGGNATSFLVSYRSAGTNNVFGEWQSVRQVGPSLEIGSLVAGKLEVRVQAFNYLGIGGTAASRTYTIYGKLTAPADLQNLSFESTSENSGRLRWTQSNDLDVKVGGKVLIRHTNDTSNNASWNNSTDLVDAQPGIQTEAVVPKMVGTVFCKFEDSSGIQSATAAKVVIGDTQKDQPIVFTHYGSSSGSPTRKDPGFGGPKVNAEVSGSVLQLTSSGGNVSSSGSYTFGSGTSSINTYDFASITDATEHDYSINFKRHLVSRGNNVSDLIDTWDDVDARTDWDGSVADKVNGRMLIRSTKQNPWGYNGITATWTDWTPFAIGTFDGRAFQFKLELTSADTTQNILVDQVGFSASMDKRTEQSVGTVTSGTSSATGISFANNFFIGGASANNWWHSGQNNTTFLPSVTITPTNLATGEYFNVTSITAAGFNVEFRNSSGDLVAKQFYWSATGFGRLS